MWVHEHNAKTDLEPRDIWLVLADLNRWTEWDTSMEWVRLDGSFEVGGKVEMKPIGQEPITSTITDIVENEKYADECQFNGLTLRFSHVLHPLGAGGTQVVHRLEIDGPGVDEIGPQIGPQITEDFPDAMDALLAHARK